MNKMWTLIAVVVLAGCGSGGADDHPARDLSTPSKRLIGHWASPAGDKLYYAPTDGEAIGGYILVQPDSNTARHRYKIISEQTSGERLIIRLLFSNGDSREATLYINAAGTSQTTETIILGRLTTTRQTYVDAETSP